MFDKELENVEVLIRNQTLVKGGWKTAKPISGPFIWELKKRLYGAIQVLLGKATVVRWY